MNGMIIHVPVPGGGEIRLPFAQAVQLGAAVGEIRDAGGEPVWHLNDCGECVSVHARGSAAGWVIDAAGGAEWFGPEAGKD